MSALSVLRRPRLEVLYSRDASRCQGEGLMVNQVMCKIARDPEKMDRFNYGDKGWEAADR